MKKTVHNEIKTDNRNRVAQKELVELKKNETPIEEIEEAAKSLGRKSQSAFKKKYYTIARNE